MSYPQKSPDSGSIYHIFFSHRLFADAIVAAK